jgi:O-antigen/teichoic acid export membrane protein
MRADLVEVPPGRDSAPHRLTSGRVLARNTAWNLLGQAIPMMAAVIAIPPLIGGLGRDRFGFLTLAWLVVGYFSLFDLGLGRALTKVVAERLGSGREPEIAPMVWTALLLMASLGLLGAGVVVALAPWLVGEAIGVPAVLRVEATRALLLLAASLPFVVTAAGLRGLLEAQQRFDLINVFGGILGAFTYVGPVLVLPFSRGLVPTVVVLVSGRVLLCVVYLILCLRSMPALRRGLVLRRESVRPLLRLGGWMTVSNLVGPLMVSLDRFLIGALISVGMVTFYAAPYEVIIKLWIIPGALIRVLFPAFATSFARDRRRAVVLFDQGVRAVFLAMSPIILALVFFAGDGLTLWVGADFARHSTRVMQWLAVGIFLNSLSLIPFTLIQALGRPDLTAKLHLAQLPFYLPALWVLIHVLGIEGAAIAWTLRVAVDTVLLFVVAQWLLPDDPEAGRWRWYVAAAALPALVLAGLPTGPAPRGLLLALALGTLLPVAWLRILSPGERGLVRRHLERALGRG